MTSGYLHIVGLEIKYSKLFELLWEIKPEDSQETKHFYIRLLCWTPIKFKGIKIASVSHVGAELHGTPGNGGIYIRRMDGTEATNSLVAPAQKGSARCSKPA